MKGAGSGTDNSKGCECISVRADRDIYGPGVGEGGVRITWGDV